MNQIKIKLDIFKYKNIRDFIYDMVNKNAISVRQFKKMLDIKSTGQAYAVSYYGIVSSNMADKLIKLFELTAEETTYFKILVEIPKMKLLHNQEKKNLIKTIYNVKRYGIQERNI